MKIKHLILGLFALILGTSQMSSQGYSVTPGRISICAASPVPEGVTPTKQTYQDLVDCGFNLGTQRGSISYFQNQFKLIGNLDFKYIVGSLDLLTDKRSEYIRALGKEKQLAGWQLKDEPLYKDLDNLSKIYNSFRKEDPNHFIYFNLVGVLEKAFTGNYKKFSDYLNLIRQKFNLQVWSFDYYPIIIRNGVMSVNYDQFYSDLEDFSSISKSTGKPFWSFCETMAYKTRSYSRPAATEAYLSFEAFSALAYGAQGIVYWAYGLRKSDNSTETFQSALVNMDGKKTDSWYAAKKVNGEIKKYNDVFYGCTVNEVKHTGNKTYKGTKKLTGRFGPLQSITTGTAGALVSYLSSNGNNYVVIVSHDVEKSQPVNLQVAADKTVMVLTEGNKMLNPSETLSLNLEKGGFIILKEI